MLERLGMIGSGGIAATLLEALACELPAQLSRLDCLTMSESMATAEACSSSIMVASPTRLWYTMTYPRCLDAAHRW